mmetsp:Transcript_7125/g.31493  ORF Transcript_7125/g.31493 Transcript_7125/m.31493 type:complete len:119 (-) Transcript_7125:1874-2230(-)
MKIIKHCHENLPLTVTGQLLGMDVGENLEITNSYSFPQIQSSTLGPNDVDRGETDLDHSQYQMNMMICVRNVNIDHQVVGWYQSSGSQVRCCGFAHALVVPMVARIFCPCLTCATLSL